MIFVEAFAISVVSVLLLCLVVLIANLVAPKTWGQTLPPPPKSGATRLACASDAAELQRMRHRIESLRGALKTAAGQLYELDKPEWGDQAIEAAGDMEPPL